MILFSKHSLIAFKVSCVGVCLHKITYLLGWCWLFVHYKGTFPGTTTRSLQANTILVEIGMCSISFNSPKTLVSWSFFGLDPTYVQSGTWWVQLSVNSFYLAVTVWGKTDHVELVACATVWWYSNKIHMLINFLVNLFYDLLRMQFSVEGWYNFKEKNKCISVIFVQWPQITLVHTQHCYTLYI